MLWGHPHGPGTKPTQMLWGHPHGPGTKPTQGALGLPPPAPHLLGPLALPTRVPRDRRWGSISQGADGTQVRVQSALLLSPRLPGGECGGRWRESMLGPQGYSLCAGLG